MVALKSAESGGYGVEQDKHDELVDLAWRYAAIIGIVDPASLDIADDAIDADRKRWARLIKIDDGMPCFDDLEGAGYMAEVSGATLSDCREVLEEVWGSYEDDSLPD
jgi:hypothetical protein